MDSKELKKLSRKDLLEILLEQAKRIEELEEALEKEQSKKDAKMSSISEVGSLAEASLVLSDIFKKADEAVVLYKNSVVEVMKKEERIHKKKLKDMKMETLQEIAKKELKAEQKIKVIEDKINSYKSNMSRTKKKANTSDDKNVKRKFRK